MQILAQSSGQRVIFVPVKRQHVPPQVSGQCQEQVAVVMSKCNFLMFVTVCRGLFVEYFHAFFHRHGLFFLFGHVAVLVGKIRRRSVA